MSDSTRPPVSAGDAFMIIVTLAAEWALTEKAVLQDPERLAPLRAKQQNALDAVEAFLQVHLYGDCKSCESCE